LVYHQDLITKPGPDGKCTPALDLVRAEMIFKRIRADPVEDKFLNFAD
jgi:hypothetical protein